jgi:hypothetical protein
MNPPTFAERTERLEVILKWSFGFALLFFYALLTYVIAVRHVEEGTSFGLPIILNSLAGLGGAWAVVIAAGMRKDRANVTDEVTPK